MLNGYIEFFMDSSLAECYLQLKEELDKLIENKVSCIWTYYLIRMLLKIKPNP